MHIETTKQPTDGPANKPTVVNPVLVTMDIPLFYATERDPVPWHHSIFCGKAFADTVLVECEKLLKEEGSALVHLGVYNPRQARHKDGTPIVPPRWSNHAYGEAMDFRGIITDNGNGHFLGISDLKKQKPNFLNELTSACKAAIIALHRKEEIVDEGGWLHMGLWPKS
jgi:hypothetical protein